MIHVAWGDSRNAARWAASSARPRRASGCIAAMASRIFGLAVMPAVNGVCVRDGAIALTRIPGANSTASDRVGFDALVSRMDLRVRIAAEIDDMAMLRLIARSDIGLAVLPPIVVKDELASGELIEVHQLPQLSETFFAVTLKRRFANPILQCLIEPRAQGALE